MGEDGKVAGQSTEESRRDKKALVGKNLGQQMQMEDDMQYKGNRMWKAFHSFKSKVAGVGLGCQAMCGAVVAVCRSVLQYGQTSRCTPDPERKWYQQLEDKVVRKLKSLNVSQMRTAGINMSDLRFQLKLSTFSTQISYLKIRQFAHWLRGNSIAGLVIRGFFIPEKVPESSKDEIEDIARAGISLRAHRGRRTYLEEQYLYLERDCCVPEYAVSALASTNSPCAKRVFYVLTREAFIRSVLKDWSQGNKVSAADVEERRKELARKYQIDNANLDSHLSFFRPGYCVLCDSCGHGGEEHRELHYHIYHDLGLRGDSYVERLAREKRRKDEEYEWEKKCRLASVRRRDIIQKKEDAFFRLNADKVTIEEPKGNRTLGGYRCKLCDEDFTTSVDAIDRHLAVHELKQVTRVYKHTPNYVPRRNSTTQKITKQPAEHRYWCKGAYTAGNYTKLFRLKIEGVGYEEGSVWKCRDCGFELVWEKGINGARVNALANRIEEHLRGKKTHGSCERMREVVKQKKEQAERRRKGKGKGKGRQNGRKKALPRSVRNASRIPALGVLRGAIGSVSRNRWNPAC